MFWRKLKKLPAQHEFGQIRSNSRFGQWVSVLAGSSETNTLVEVGTWKGMGSTLLIAQALAERSDVIAVSLEANLGFHKIASKNLVSFKSPELVWGSVVEPHGLDDSDLRGDESVWLQDDLRALEEAPLVRSKIPKRVDFLLLDGGEFSSWAEFEFFFPRASRFILLDDTLVRKNRKVEAFLAADPGWRRLDSGQDRNGWSVWIKVSGLRSSS